MVKQVVSIVLGLGFGIITTLFLINNISKISPEITHFLSPLGLQSAKIIGFLPYWLLSDAEKNYADYLTDIQFFAITIDEDGTILKRTKPTETEPGWLSLNSGKMSKYIEYATKNNLNKSLVLFLADEEKISALLSNPLSHATTMINAVEPIMKEYGFSEINLDIESFQTASEEARTSFTLFTKTVREQMDKKKLGKLSIDISPTALIKPYLIDVKSISPYVDTVIFMTYDFHYQGSIVTGAVSPIGGVPKTAEFDTETSIKEALRVLPPEKIIMGVPLYGYEWETLGNIPRSATIPGSGITASNKRVEELLELCASCSAQFDEMSKESYVIYKDQETETFHQIFYPDKKAMEEKIKLMKKYRLGGIALWALGYEGKTILDPLKNL